MVDCSGDKFLSRTTFPGDHHRCFAVRHAPDHFEDLLHRLGLADDAVLMLIDGKLWLEGRRSAHLGLGLERGVYHDLQIKRQRFLADEIVGPQLHRFDDRLGGAERAGEHHHRVRVLLSHLGEQFEAAVRLEVRFGDEQVGVLSEIKFVCFVGPARSKDLRGGSLKLVRRPL